MTTSTFKIRTPEGIVFSLLLASPLTRSLAWIIDFGCVSVASSVLGGALGVVGVFSRDLANAVVILTFFAVQIGYGMAAEWYWQGQTIGKRLLGLRVMDAWGLRLQPSQIVIRNLLRFVDSLPLFYLVGGLACAVSRKAQRLGDVAANTIVVLHPHVEEPDLEQINPGKFNSLRDYPHLEARMRQRISPQEAVLAVGALVRREQLDPRARIELFGEIAQHFRSLIEFPVEATEGMADEQYLRNVVESLYRSRKRVRGSPRNTGKLNSRP